MRFRPRALPIQWLLSAWHKQKETLTFEADLGGSPSFHLQVVRHRWCAHSRGIRTRRKDEREWDLYQPGPIILTTRTHWKQDASPELNALMAVRQQDVLQVRFRPESPQFSATVNLDSLSDPQSAAGFLSTLRELAAGAVREGANPRDAEILAEACVSAARRIMIELLALPVGTWLRWDVMRMKGTVVARERGVDQSGGDIIAAV